MRRKTPTTVASSLLIASSASAHPRASTIWGSSSPSTILNTALPTLPAGLHHSSLFRRVDLSRKSSSHGSDQNFAKIRRFKRIKRSLESSLDNKYKGSDLDPSVDGSWPSLHDFPTRRKRPTTSKQAPP